MEPGIELAVLSARYDAAPDHEERVGAVLAHHVVTTRRRPRCRNVDLLASTTVRGRFLVLEKWEHPDAARAHLDSEAMAAMAREIVPHLAAPPVLDLWDGISAHDLT